MLEPVSVTPATQAAFAPAGDKDPAYSTKTAGAGWSFSVSPIMANALTF